MFGVTIWVLAASLRVIWCLYWLGTCISVCDSGLGSLCCGASCAVLITVVT